MIGTGQKIAGLQIVEKRCAKCSGPMYVKAAPCFMKGWATCIKCVKCGHTEGHKMKRRV